MSPHMAVDERLRRLAPIATGAAAFGIAVLRMRFGEQALLVAALIAVAVALVAHAIATVRGSVGIIAGMVGGLWLAAAATEAAAAAAAATAAATAAGTALVVAILAVLLARADKLEAAPPAFAAPIAAAIVAIEPRAWALAAVVAALVVLRDRGRRRWLAAAPALGAIGGGVITLLGALERTPAWAPRLSRVSAETWVNDAVDGLGPVAIVVAAIGVYISIADRRARWTAAAIVASFAAAIPLSSTTPSVALVGLALAIGMSAAAISARVGRTRQQALVGAAIAAVLVAHAVI